MIATYAGDANHTGSSGSATMTINKASSSTTTVGAGPFTYTGADQTGGSGTVTGANLSTSATSVTYSSANHTNAGTYYVTAHYAGDANHTASDGLPVAITIAQASSTVSLLAAAAEPIVFDTLAHGTSATVTGAGVFTGSPTLAYYSGTTQLSGAPVDVGTYTVIATYAGDANHTGNVSAPATITIVAPNTVTISRDVAGNLLVVGTAGNDTITVNTIDATHVSITVNGVVQDSNTSTAAIDSWTVASTGHAIVYGLVGNDTITMNGSMILEAHGGSGDDDITGGSGNDVLLGGDGNDIITGGAGHDVLVGGFGANRLVGSAGNDILIAGELSATDSNYGFLSRLSAHWSAGITTDLAGDGDDDVLAVNTTTDGKDMLTGSSGADWFIITVGFDKITDLAKTMAQNKDGDLVSDISTI